MKHVPNTLTVLRIALAPVVVALLFGESALAAVLALALFVLAALTDWLDGKLAREFRVRSRLGQFLDPLADKVLVLGTFVALAIKMPAQVPLWAVAVIALRDVGVTLLRTRREAKGKSLRTSHFAKAKTAVQLSFLIGVLALRAVAALPGGEGASGLLGSGLIFFLFLGVVLLTVLTGLAYVIPDRTQSVL